MEKKITEKQFIDTYNAATNKQEVLESVVVNKYIPFRIKLECAKLIVENHNLINKEIKSDTGKMYLSFTASILRLYTRLEVSNTDTDLDYDLLQEQGLVDIILNTIGKDLEEYRKIFAMCEEDFRTNYLSTPSFVQRQVTRVIHVLEKYVHSLQSWLNKIDNDKINILIDEIQKQNKKQ